MNNKTFLKRTEARKLKNFSELGALNISWAASLVIALVLLYNNFDKSVMGFYIDKMSFPLGLAYLAAAALSLALALASRAGIKAKDGIAPWVRAAAVLLVPFVLIGNVFSAIAGFMTAKKTKPIEYHLAYFSILNNMMVFVIGSLNLFKPELPENFWLGQGLLALSMAFYAVALVLVSRAADTGRYARLAPLAAILALTAAVGNVFALLLALVVFARIRNEGGRNSIEWVETLRRVFRNYMAILGLLVIVVLLTLSVVSALTFDYRTATSNDYSTLMRAPSMEFPFGTDDLGRCIFTRIVFGARISLIIGMISTAAPFVVGGLLGAAAGFYENRLDNVIMRVMDVFFAVPGTLLTIAIIAAFGANMLNLIIALSISNVPVYARTMRAQVMVTSNSEFVEAARGYGRRPFEILLKHVVPNSMAPMIVRASVSIGIAVLSTSSLSYLGLGVEPKIPEWGNILKIGSKYLETNPYLAIYPGIFIIVLVLAFNFLGDGMRDALDPKLK
ncbi:MAG: ABC transporter permease [Clostridiales Family XIII bacterium]|nr:ABC transporter permease [Clostridiales Family XIII bacterium]